LDVPLAVRRGKRIPVAPPVLLAPPPLVPPPLLVAPPLLVTPLLEDWLVDELLDDPLLLSALLAATREALSVTMSECSSGNSVVSSAAALQPPLSTWKHTSPDRVSDRPNAHVLRWCGAPMRFAGVSLQVY
jgi:hypothetical protein